MIIAVDTSISSKVVRALNKSQSKHAVVYKAKAGESDRRWINNGLKRGATVFISNDSDIPRLLNKISLRLYWIDLDTNRLPRNEQCEFILKRLEEIE